MKKKDLFIPDEQDEKSMDRLLKKKEIYDPNYNAMAEEYIFHAMAYTLEKVLPQAFDSKEKNAITGYPDEDYLRLIEDQIGVDDRDKYREEITSKFSKDNRGIEGMKIEDAQINIPEEVVYACKEVCDIIIKEYEKIQNEEKSI